MSPAKLDYKVSHKEPDDVVSQTKPDAKGSQTKLDHFQRQNYIIVTD
jgi:hypothetical protein